MLARRSKKCYFGEGNCHFRAQKSAISGETFAGASQGLDNRVSFLCRLKLRYRLLNRRRCHGGAPTKRESHCIGNNSGNVVTEEVAGFAGPTPVTNKYPGARRLYRALPLGD